jgi:uncharacterized pyridoxamine 5'-phosphate oxidase family protein
MERSDLIDFIKENTVCYLATVEGEQPRVRAFRVWLIDDSGIYLDTADYKDTYKQLNSNPRCELCFHPQGKKEMLRVSGEVEFTDEPELRKKLFGDKPDNAATKIFVIRSGTALMWHRDETGKSHKEKIDF